MSTPAVTPDQHPALDVSTHHFVSFPSGHVVGIPTNLDHSTIDSLARSIWSHLKIQPLLTALEDYKNGRVPSKPLLVSAPRGTWWACDPRTRANATTNRAPREIDL